MNIIYLLANGSAYGAVYPIGKIFGVILVLGVTALFILSLVKAILTKRKVWMGAVVVHFSLLLFCFVGLVVYEIWQNVKKAQGASVEDLHLVENTQEVVTDDGSLRFTLPDAWKKITLHEDASLQYGHLIAEQYMIVITESKSDFEEGLSLETFKELCLDSMRSASSDFTEEETKRLVISDHNVLQLATKGSVDGIKVKYLNSYAETEDHYHQILMWTLSSRWERNESLFEAVMDSMQTTVRETK